MEEVVDRCLWVYDLETLSNCFTYSARNVDTKEIRQYVIHYLRDDIFELMEHLDNEVKGMIGFNNVGFDYPILHYLINLKYKDNMGFGAKEAYAKAQEIISLQDNSLDRMARYKVRIPKSKVIIPQLDLHLINHFDNQAKRTSLKALQCSLNYPNVQDMPIHHSTKITTLEQINEILEYNLNDVDSTEVFYWKCTEAIDLRKKLSQQFNLSLMNSNDPGMGSEIFLDFVAKDMQIEKKELRQMRTPREYISFNEIILDYIKFEDLQLQHVLLQFKNRTIRNTKGEFDIDFIHGGIKYYCGTGGIHACIKPGVYESSDDLMIMDIDVTSFYPNLAIENGFRPEHLGDSFNRVYKFIFEERTKIPKKDPRNAAYKLMLNGVYGKSNEQYSWLYDPKFTMQITINGQLLILMLAEQLSKLNCTILQANTDGITVLVKRELKEKIDLICKSWEELTKLKLESTFYRKMIIRDVNNYIGFNEDLSKETKYKGAFQIKKELHKDNSFIIVQKAISEYFDKGTSIDSFIRNYKDIYDFCGRQKFQSDQFGEIHSLKDGQLFKDKTQKVTRYYISTNGQSFIKNYTDKNGKILKDEFINKGYKVTIFNKYVTQEDYKIDYNFYILQANKILEEIEDCQLSLF